ncbi:MAG: hypothetical protein SNJ78_08860 [Spirochaetales bacterium]
MKITRMVDTIRVFGVILLVTGGFFSCATPSKSKDSAAAEGKTPPEWVITPPRETAEHYFFVGSASDLGGDAAKAEEQAIYNLMAEITRYLGVRVTAETTSEARATLDRFQAEVVQQVRQEGSARLVGLKVTDKYIQRERNRITVYLLAQYQRSELEKEKARIAAVFQEQVDAVAVPEQKGRRLEQQGDLFGAIQSYIEAAVAATTSRMENAEIRFERNINNAKRVVSRISILPLTGEVGGMIGDPLPEPFRIKVVDGSSTSDPPVSGADIQVSFKESRAGGRTSVRTTVLKSGEDGIVEFQHPVPTFIGRESVALGLDLSPYLRPLETVPRQYRSLVNSLTDLALSKRVDIPLIVVSRAKNIPTGVVVLDLDAAGNPTGANRTRAGVVEALTEEGFRTVNVALDPISLRNQSETDFIRTLSTQFGAQIDRIVFGTVSIDEFIEERGQFQVRVSGTLKAADLKTGQVLYTRRLLKRSIGANAEAALSAAFRNLGIDFGKDLARSLP